MVIHVDIDVNQLAIQGKDFCWQKPSACPRCGARLWWHGFVLAYLACFTGFFAASMGSVDDPT